MEHSPPPVADPRSLAALRRLVALRWWLLAGELATLSLVPPFLGIPLPWAPMLVVIGLHGLVNGLAARRGRNQQAIGEAGLFVQILVDIVALSVLMFFSGGAANPLISLLLLPVAIAALALPARAVAVLAFLAVAAYSLLMELYLPLPVADAGRAARLHLAGMWATFVFSVALVAWFVVRMTASIRQRDAELAAAREQALRDERVVALGVLAAGTAHELSTPLATMAVIAGELEQDEGVDAAVRADLAVLRQQVQACKGIISRLADQAGASRLDAAQAVQSDRWLQGVDAAWRQLRPQVAGGLSLAGKSPAPKVVAEATLEQGIVNLLNNAANAGQRVDVTADWDDVWLTIEVRDDGPGFAEEVLRRAGREPLPPRAGGTGIGLFLARAAIERLGGSLSLCNGSGGGIARVRLPVG